MWIEPKDEETNKQQSNTNEPSVGAGGGALAPSSTANTAGNPSTINPVQSNSPTQNFATVQDYFKASQPQGEQLGQQFTTKLGESAAKEQGTIGEAVSKTKGDIASNTVAFDPNLVSTAVKDPTKVAGNQDQLGSFIKQWNAAYQGPESFEGSNAYTSAANAANEASQKQAELGSTGGRQQLLQDEFGVYGQGNKGLDEALLQQSSYFPKVQEQSKQFGTIQDYLKNQAQDINTRAQAAKQQTEQTKAATQQAFEGRLGAFQGDINARVGAERTKASDLATRYQRDLASGDTAAVEKDLRDAGTPEDQIKTISSYLQGLNKDYSINPDLSKYYSFNPNIDINAANVATPEDYARAQAYQTLTGVNYSGVLNPADISKAGNLPNPKAGLNTPGLSTYLKTALGQQDTTLLNTPLRVDNPTTRKPADNLIPTVDRYINAATRQGLTLKDSPTLQKILNDATTAYSGGIRGGLPANSPDLVPYQAIIQRLQGIGAPQVSTGTGKKPDIQIPENVSNPKPQINPGVVPSPTDYGNVIVPGEPRQPTNVVPINKLTEPTPVAVPTNPEPTPGRVAPTGPGNAPNTPAKTGKDISQQLLTQWQKQNPGAKPEFVNNAKADFNNIAGLYDRYMSKSITPKDYIVLQNLLKKYGTSI